MGSAELDLVATGSHGADEHAQERADGHCVARQFVRHDSTIGGGVDLIPERDAKDRACGESDKSAIEGASPARAGGDLDYA
jgi:hypothetical protein